jgi:hypothetical protein
MKRTGTVVEIPNHARLIEGCKTQTSLETLIDRQNWIAPLPGLAPVNEPPSRPDFRLLLLPLARRVRTRDSTDPSSLL